MDCAAEGFPPLTPAQVQPALATKKDPPNLAQLREEYAGRLRSVFVDNTATRQGGAVACIDCDGVVLRDTTLHNNAAEQGGALFTLNSRQATQSRS